MGRRRPRLRRPSPALIVAMIALFVSLQQTGLAGRALRAAGCNCGTSADIVNNSLTGVDIKDGSLTKKEFKKGTIPRQIRGAKGDKGDPGTNGAKGDKGDPGAPGLSTGPASGDLTGNYPGPQIAANAVGSAEIVDESLAGADIGNNAIGNTEMADNAIGAAEITNGSITGTDLLANTLSSTQIGTSAVFDDELGSGAVRSAEFATVFQRTGPGIVVAGGAAENGTYFTRADEALCLAGEQLLAGGGQWNTEANDQELPIIDIRRVLSGSQQGIRVRGGNDSGTDRELTAWVLCLAA